MKTDINQPTITTLDTQIMTNHSYEVNISWDSQRKGTLSSPVLDESIEVATPPEFNGGMEGIWSPEHLFVASVSSCLMTTFLAIAEYSKLNFTGFGCKAVGKLEKTDKGFAVTEIRLTPSLQIDHEHDLEKAERILRKAEASCLISNSITSRIVFEPKVRIEEPV